MFFVKEKSVVGLWLKLERLCRTKSLKSKLHLKQHFYSNRLTEGTSLEDHLSVLRKIGIDLETIEAKYDEKDLSLILLCLLPPLYVTFRDTILYSWDTLTIDMVYDVSYSKVMIKHLVVGFKVQIENLVIHERKTWGHGMDKVMDINNNKVCWYCNK